MYHEWIRLINHWIKSTTIMIRQLQSLYKKNVWQKKREIISLSLVKMNTCTIAERHYKMYEQWSNWKIWWMKEEFAWRRLAFLGQFLEQFWTVCVPGGKRKANKMAGRKQKHLARSTHQPGLINIAELPKVMQLCISVWLLRWLQEKWG